MDPEPQADVEEMASRQNEVVLDAVDLALDRLDDGTYGTCEVCGEGLADDLLVADPTARRCPAHGDE